MQESFEFQASSRSLLVYVAQRLRSSIITVLHPALNFYVLLRPIFRLASSLLFSLLLPCSTRCGAATSNLAPCEARTAERPRNIEEELRTCEACNSDGRVHATLIN